MPPFRVDVFNSEEAEIAIREDEERAAFQTEGKSIFDLFGPGEVKKVGCATGWACGIAETVPFGSDYDDLDSASVRRASVGIESMAG